MKLGVFTPLFNQLSFEEMIDEVAKKGCKPSRSVPVFSGNAHLDIDRLLASEAERKNT